MNTVNEKKEREEERREKTDIRRSGYYLKRINKAQLMLYKFFLNSQNYANANVAA